MQRRLDETRRIDDERRFSQRFPDLDEAGDRPEVQLATPRTS
jgi:hypothetical protein